MMMAEAGKDKVLQEDLEQIADCRAVLQHRDQLRNASVLITGATGLIGSLLVKTFAALSRKNDLHMDIYPVIRNREKAEIVYGDLLKRADVHLIEADITERDFVSRVQEQIAAEQQAGPAKERRRASDAGQDHPARVIDYIFHAAAVTTSRVMVEKPIETIDSAILGTKNLLELAAAAKTRSFVYISSMEAYGDMSVYGAAGSGIRTAGAGTPEDGKQPGTPWDSDRGAGAEELRATEDMQGYVNPEAVRSDYPLSKRMCENMCIAYLTEKQVPVKIARLAQTFGAGVLPWEKRVFAQFAHAAMEGRDIVLHTKGLSEGNYCYSADCMRGLLTILLDGGNGEAYNVANESCHTTIAGMAAMVAERIAGGKIRVVYDIPETNTFGYAADTKLFLDSSRLQALGWKPEVDLPEMYRRMIGSLMSAEE